MTHSSIAELDRDILDFINRGIGQADEERFNELAQRVFELQYANLAPFRQYCESKGASPESVESWRKIPAVPSAAFKSHTLASFPLEQAVQSNLTSGTTGRKNRGQVYRDEGSLRLIKSANGLMTRSFLFPDVERMKILFMVPSPQVAPGMGMAIGMEEVRRRFGTEESAFLISRTGLDIKSLLKGLREAEQTGVPIALIGATSGFIYFFNICRKEGISFSLPPGSRVCDGGGYMGQFGECSKDEFFERCQAVFGLAPSHCVNVLGTAESSTNYFDNVLGLHYAKETGERYKISPPWTRTLVVDPHTLEPVAKGETGLLRHYDLANRAMVLGVQTDNLGVERGDGFEILGRWSKEKGAYVINYSGGMPGGKVVSKLLGFLMNRGMGRVGRLYKKL